MNWNLVINSRFRPFSYDEMVKPLLQYKEAYDDSSKDFSSLATQTEAWRDIAMREQNPVAYSMFEEYSNALNSAVDNFSRGMSINDNPRLIDLKRGYASKIVPIQNAYNTRLKQIDEQMKGKAAGIVYASDAASTSIDEYIKNPSLQHEFADSNAGYKRVLNAATALSKKLSKVDVERIDQYTKAFLQEHGYRDSEISQAIQDIQGALIGDGNERGMGILQSILDTEMNTSGVSSWKDESRKLDYLNRVAPALYAAVGQTDLKPMEDYGARLNAQMNKEKEMYKWKKTQESPDSNEKLFRESSATSVDSDKKTSQIQSDIEFLRAVQNNPKIEQDKATRIITVGGSNVTPPTSISVKYSPTQERLKNISKRYNLDLRLNSDGTNNFDEAIGKLEGDIRKSAIRSTSYIVDITDPSLIAKTIRENSLSLYRRTGNTGIYDSDGDQVDISEVLEYMTPNSLLEYDPSSGLEFTGINKDNKEKSFHLDPEVVTASSIVANGRRKNRYQSIMDDIDIYIDEENTEGLEVLIPNFMNELHYQFNSTPKRQGLTLSNKE